MSPALPGDWLVPDWPAAPGVHALCTTRSGGVSSGPYASLNLSLNVGDEPAAVHENRARLAGAMLALQRSQGAGEAPAPQPVLLHQVHGAEVEYLDACSAGGSHADASVTATPGVGCAIMVADCLPVLFAHRHLPIVGAAHAGWRGLVGQGGVGVLETTFEAFRALAQQQQAPDAHQSIAPGDMLAWLGPCIGQAAFEVGAEVREAFVAHDAGADVLFAPGKPGKFQADLAGLARRRLQAMGIAALYGNDGSEPWCTVSNPARFFSHRRDGSPGVLGGSGRFGVCIWVAD
ncbi:peptidoglycan editing factor PgeF [Comamonas humi]